MGRQRFLITSSVDNRARDLATRVHIQLGQHVLGVMPRRVRADVKLRRNRRVAGTTRQA